MDKPNIQSSKVHQKKVQELNREFEQIFSLIQKNNSTTDHFNNDKFQSQLISMIQRHYFKIIALQFFKLSLIIIVGFSLIYYINFLNWNFSAIGRILMIKLLRFWDWKHLYNSNCLISVEQQTTTVNAVDKDYSEMNNDVSNLCVTCENLGNLYTLKAILSIIFEKNYQFYLPEHVARISADTSSIMIERKYLKRHRPIIIEPIIYHTTSIDSKNFIDRFMLILDTLDAGYCNIQSNYFAKNTANLHELMASINNTDETDGFFIHFRNCNFNSVKASRIFWKKPNYLLLHLSPFYSSWILISKNYQFKRAKYLDVQGMILVNQISGKLEISLQPRKPCDVDCVDMQIQLTANEVLMFIADLWEFSYNPIDNDVEKSITFITEFDWK